MQQLIEDLKSIPGVMGAYVYHPNEGIRSNNLPPLFKTERIMETARNLAKITAAGRHNFQDLSDIFLSFEESSILCRQLADTNFVIAVCDPDINFNVLSMSLNLAMEEVNSRIVARQPENITPNTIQTPATVATPTVPASPSASSSPAPSNPANLTRELKVLGQALTKFLGPMARIVFDDAFAEWSTGRTPSANDLPALIDTLCQEIGDADKEKSFREMVREHLPQAIR